MQLKAQEIAETEVTMSHELRKLASECLLAFEVAGLSASEIPQVRKATELCHTYTP